MKKIVINYGLLSGLVMAVLMTISWAFAKQIGFKYGMVVGYTTMILAMAVMFWAMVSYRDKVGDGRISFGKAVQIGLLIGVVTCIFYVVAWTVIYHTIIPDFFDRYIAFEKEGMVSAGKSQQDIDKMMQQMQSYKNDYKNPFLFVLYTIMEPLPAVLVVTLACALLVRKKSKSITQTA